MRRTNRWVLSVTALLLCLSSLAARAQEADPVPRDTVGLALAGGGALGFAHVGVLLELEEMGIPIDYVAGTSIGSVVGALYAAGYSAEDILEISRETKWNELFTDEPDRRSLPYDARRRESTYSLRLGFQGTEPILQAGVSPGQSVVELLDDLLSRYAVSGSFDRLPRPLRVIATNLRTGEEKVFSDGDLKTAIRASLAVPGVFTPVHYRGEAFIDGGWANLLPVDRLLEFEPDYIIAVRLGELASADELESAPAVLDQASQILRHRRLRENLAYADVVINPDVSDFTVASFGAATALIERGRQAARAVAPGLSRLEEQVSASAESRGASGGSRAQDYVLSQRLISPASERELAVEEIVFSRDAPPEAEQAELRTAVIGETTTKRVRDAVYSFYGTGDYRHVSYTLQPVDDTDGHILDVDMQVKERVATEVQGGFAYQSDLWTSTAPGFTAFGNLLLRDIWKLGSRWSTSVWLGEVLSASTHFRYPLGGNSAATAALYNVNQLVRFYEERRVTSVYSVPKLGFRPGLVSVVSDAAELRIDGLAEWVEPILRTGAVREIEADRFRVGGNAAARADTRDQFPYPRRGTETEVSYHARYLFDPSLFYHHASVTQRVYAPILEESSLLYEIKLASDFDSGLPDFEYYALGGLRSFQGLYTNELRGNHLAAVAGEARIRFLDLPFLAGQRLFVRFRIDLGGVWASTYRGIIEAPGIVAGFGIGLDADTIAGRAGLGIGVTSDGRVAAGIALGNEMDVPFIAEGVE